MLQIFDGDVEVAEFMQRFFGYCLTGVTTEQKILIPWGDGANGKSTILGAVQRVLGRDYCGTAPPKLLEASSADRHPTEIADLYGKRLVIASETEDGAQIREAFLKLATGSDPLKARHMREDFFEFTPTHKFVLQTNHKPEVKGTDHAIWRRFLLAPCEVTFGDEEEIASGDAKRLKDPHLPGKLVSELDGILTWMAEGCAQWQAQGLAAPAKVLGATAAYREEQDRVGQFLAEVFQCAPALSTEQAIVYNRYRTWAENNGYRAMGSNKFRKQVLRTGRDRISAGRTTTGPRKNVATYDGLGDPEQRMPGAVRAMR